ncbi:dihydrofolate reductase [Brevundimonas sp. 2R-24]|uniref:Dihydrofolate reductase n=1 Tax=Peiella sedimenti TaxID=3061083 RepID=A0ABT8SLH9_9CAUL|nr:dihydrofolate reductase [Caulobacteraceae bacterium XZ-24]
MMPTTLSLVVARARNGVIGRNGRLPWRLRADLQLFKANTIGKPCLMGRKTWESLPLRPLPGRLNLVLSGDPELKLKGALVCPNFDEAYAIAREQAREDGVDEVCVIGGTQLFETALPRARRLYLTEVEAEPEGDAHFPAFDESQWTEVRRERHEADETNDHAFVFRLLERR